MVEAGPGSFARSAFQGVAVDCGEGEGDAGDCTGEALGETAGDGLPLGKPEFG